MYAPRNDGARDQTLLEEQYKVEVSTDLISTVTDSVLEDVIEWQKLRPLGADVPGGVLRRLESQNP